jgi:hypothetical protein
MAKRPRRHASGLTLMQVSREMSAVAKARYHDQDGAGRGRVVRRFFGLTEAEMTGLQDKIERAIARALGV